MLKGCVKAAVSVYLLCRTEIPRQVAAVGGARTLGIQEGGGGGVEEEGVAGERAGVGGRLHRGCRPRGQQASVRR